MRFKQINSSHGDAAASSLQHLVIKAGELFETCRSGLGATRRMDVLKNGVYVS